MKIKYSFVHLDEEKLKELRSSPDITIMINEITLSYIAIKAILGLPIFMHQPEAWEFNEFDHFINRNKKFETHKTKSCVQLYGSFNVFQSLALYNPPLFSSPSFFDKDLFNSLSPEKK